MLALTPDRIATAQEFGETAAKGIYKMLDIARQNATLRAKMLDAATDGKST